VESHRLPRQRLLQHARSFRLSGTVGRCHRHHRQHTRRDINPRQTAGQLSPKLPISLDRLAFLPCAVLSLPNLIGAILIEQLPGGVAADRRPADVITHNLDTFGIEVSGPPEWRLRQVQAQHGHRDERLKVRRLVSGQLNDRGSGFKHYFSDINSGCFDGEAGRAA
jgi:hypothetical protein